MVGMTIITLVIDSFWKLPEVFENIEKLQAKIKLNVLFIVVILEI